MGGPKLREMCLKGALLLLLAGTHAVLADCTVPLSWGPYVISTDCKPGDIRTNGQTCTLSCPQPTGQYNATGGTAATCDGTNFIGFSLTCTLTNAPELPIWCGDASKSYVNGLLYYELSTAGQCDQVNTIRKVWCDPTKALTGQYNQATQPALTCCVTGTTNPCSAFAATPPPTYAVCALPGSFGNYVIGDSTAPQGDCQEGFPLFPLTSANTNNDCAVTCEFAPPPDPTTIPGIYSCSADASLIPVLNPPAPALQCPSDGQCIISNTFTYPVQDLNCTSVFLDVGTYCYAQCATGYVRNTGDDTYNCQLVNGLPALINNVTLTCKAAPCLLPTDFGSNIDQGTCTPGGLLDGDGLGNSCDVACADGSAGTGSPTYTCSYGDLTNATLACPVTTCTLPTGVVCNNGQPLPNGGQCNVACASGYVPDDPQASTLYTCTNGVVQGSYTCSVPVSKCALTQGVVCQNGKTLGNGDACRVRCDTGYSPNNPGVSNVYYCWQGVTYGSYTCKAGGQSCNLPTGVACTSGQTTLQDGGQCQVSCISGYTPVDSSQPTQYTCSNGVAGGTYRCQQSTPGGQCALPTGVQCSNGGTLSPGGSCNVQCSSGYVPINPNRYPQYLCDSNGVVYGSYRCTPGGGGGGNSCQLPWSFGSNIVGVTCRTNAWLTDGESCTVRCAQNCRPYGSSTDMGYYKCKNGRLIPPNLYCIRYGSGGGGGWNPPQKPNYCIGPYGRQMQRGYGYTMNNVGQCARYWGTTYVWCANGYGRAQYMYCCGRCCSKYGYGSASASPASASAGTSLQSASAGGQSNGFAGYYDDSGKHYMLN